MHTIYAVMSRHKKTGETAIVKDVNTLNEETAEAKARDMDAYDDPFEYKAVPFVHGSMGSFELEKMNSYRKEALTFAEKCKNLESEIVELKASTVPNTEYNEVAKQLEECKAELVRLSGQEDVHPLGDSEIGDYTPTEGVEFNTNPETREPQE